jgi:hypothetical protein
MAYRSDEQALQNQLAVLDRELSRIRAKQDALQLELSREEQGLTQACSRLAEAGPGGGVHRSGRRDRIDLAAVVLLAVSLPPLFFHCSWHNYVGRDPTVIPAILWLATPGLLATLMVFPYRRRGRRFRALLLASLAMSLVPLLNLALGLL